MINIASKRYRWLYWFLISLLLISIFSTICFIAYLSVKMRLSGDDYCYNAILSKEGFLGMQIKSYMEVSMYSGNRYSQTFFSGLSGLIPILGNGLLVISSLITWIVGLTCLVRLISKHLHIRMNSIESTAIAGSYACFVLWSTQKLDQSILWRSAMTAYFLPIVTFSWLLVICIRVAESEGLKWWRYIAIFIIAIISAGFSETATSLQGGVLGLLLLVSIFLIIKGKKSLVKYFFPVLISFLGVIVGIALLYFSPVTAMRRSSMPPPIEIRKLVSLLSLNVKVYLWQALMRRTLTVIIPLIFGLSLGFFYIFENRKNELKKISLSNFTHWLFSLICLIFVSIFLVMCVMLPATYIQVSYPPERVLVLGQSVLTMGWILGGILIIILFDSIFSFSQLKDFDLSWVIKLVLIFMVMVSSILIITQNIEKIQFYDRWSRLWDIRHKELLVARQKNIKEIHVIQLDHVIDDVGDLSPDPDYWYNNCAEMYYGFDKLYADQPGW